MKKNLLVCNKQASMKILSNEQIRRGDAHTIANEPILSIDLMERAATKIFDWITNNYPKNSKFSVFCGLGNNGGDGLAVARMLIEKSYQCDVYVCRVQNKTSTDFETNLARLKTKNNENVYEIINDDFLPIIHDNEIVIDSIFGSGLSHSPEGLSAIIINHINKFAKDVISIDIPSGLFCDENVNNTSETIVRAKTTLTFQFPKQSFFYPENDRFVGKWFILPIGIHPDFIASVETKKFYITGNEILSILHCRRKFAHKRNFGHALLISGSYGKMGAAILASKACLRTGVGLLTVHVPKLGYEIIQSVVPEAMTIVDKYDKLISSVQIKDSYNSVGIGPGIGKSLLTQQVLRNIIETVRNPMIFDADAINILAENKDWLSLIPAESIFTPHFKEFERLIGTSNIHSDKLKQQVEFSKKYNCFVVLKGAHSSISCPDGSIFFNSTGNPGMATGGSGDVLTGIILSLLAQGYSSKNAAIVGVYLHGLAGDIAAQEIGEESLIAGDIIESIGKAYHHIRKDDTNKICKEDIVEKNQKNVNT